MQEEVGSLVTGWFLMCPELHDEKPALQTISLSGPPESTLPLSPIWEWDQYVGSSPCLYPVNGFNLSVKTFHVFQLCLAFPKGP